jgi:hypothetical protein
MFEDWNKSTLKPTEQNADRIVNFVLFDVVIDVQRVPIKVLNKVFTSWSSLSRRQSLPASYFSLTSVKSHMFQLSTSNLRLLKAQSKRSKLDLKKRKNEENYQG